MIDASILPSNMFKLMALATVLGLVIIVTATLCVVGAVLWGVTTLLTIFLAHTSSAQLLAMIVVGYGGYTAIQKVRLM